MPQFFDPNNLTPEQRSRWGWAMAEYARVQEQNLDRAISKMPPEALADQLKGLPAGVPREISALRAHLRQLGQLLGGGGAGDVSSALFARLLRGKAPLPLPPPTAYSYPWYDVIEEAGPFEVEVRSVTAWTGGGERGQHDPRSIAILQCGWDVVWANDAARQLLLLQSALAEGAAQAARPGAAPCHEVLKEARACLLGAYAANPTFIVRYQEWPEYRLRLGRHRASCLWRYAQEVQGQGRAQWAEDVLARGQVFDIGGLRLNPLVSDEGVPAQAEGVERSRGSSETTVTLHYDGWILEKMPIAPL